MLLIASSVVLRVTELCLVNYHFSRFSSYFFLFIYFFFTVFVLALGSAREDVIARLVLSPT